MSENSKKWKSKLLSSSVPLEFEVAKILSERKFIVSYDYSYLRRDGVEQKEFSTDIDAILYYPLDNDNQIDGSLNILAECKYRDEGKKWLFVPDINDPDFSNFTVGNTIRSLKEFSNYRIKGNKIEEFEQTFEFSLKGIEVNTISGDVFDKDVKHGICQLKFALPYLIKDQIENNIHGHIDDADLKFIVPVLITNAELFLLNDNFSISQLKNVETIEEISKKVPYLILYSDIGPDFTEHHKMIFKDFYKENRNIENLSKLEDRQKKFKYGRLKISYSPLESIYKLQESFRWKLLSNYSQFFVCTFQEFPTFIDNLMKTISMTLRKKAST